MKHLNPRQGITTSHCTGRTTPHDSRSVKHLNPRQGITTRRFAPNILPAGTNSCETPKSPPGDYNGSRGLPLPSGSRNRPCETPKSPPGDYNFCHILVDKTLVDTRNLCETPKSPPGDYNTSSSCPPFRRPVIVCVKHLNPRQGITTLARKRRVRLWADSSTLW